MLLTRLSRLRGSDRLASGPTWHAAYGRSPSWALPSMELGRRSTGWPTLSACRRFSPLLGPWWQILATGALHEDGLADAADGLGGGTTFARKLEIMRDSRIGTYGAAALFLSLIVRTAAIAALGPPRVVLTAMIVAGVLGRSAMIVPPLVLPPARADGWGLRSANLARLAPRPGWDLRSSPRLCCCRLSLADGVGAWVRRFIRVGNNCRRQLGGYTGDILGAAEVVTESIVLISTVCSIVQFGSGLTPSPIRRRRPCAGDGGDGSLKVGVIALSNFIR